MTRTRRHAPRPTWDDVMSSGLLLSSPAREPWLAVAVCSTDAEHVRETMMRSWPVPASALVELRAELGGEGELRVRIEVRSVHSNCSADVALHWLEGLAARLRVASCAPRLVAGSQG